MDVARAVCLFHVVMGETKLGTTTYRIRHDLAGKFVEFSLQCVSGPARSTVVAAAGVLGSPIIGHGAQSDYFPASDSTPPYLLEGNGSNTKPPGNDKSRGTYLGAAVAQALQGDCASVTTPPETPNASDLDP